MTRRAKKQISTFLIVTQLFFSLFAPLTPFTFLLPQAFASPDNDLVNSTRNPGLFFQAQDTDGSSALHIKATHSTTEPIAYSLYYRHDGALQAIMGEIYTDTENVLYIGTQSGDEFTAHEWDRVVFKVRYADQHSSYYLEKSSDEELLGRVETVNSLELSSQENDWLTWQIDKETQTAVTRGPVQLHEEYIFPLNEKVKVEFTALPEESSALTIRELELSQELAEKFGTSQAFDITTEMENRKFKLNLHLPLPSDVFSKQLIDVVFAETEGDLEEGLTTSLTSGLLEKDDLGASNVSLSINDDIDAVSVSQLNHLSVYIVSNKVQICHATSSHQNPYAWQSVSVNSIMPDKYNDGPVWESGIDKGWGDIIPPFSYRDGKYEVDFPGHNWSEETELWLSNGCDLSGSETPIDPTLCGNGIIDFGEQCDYGELNGSTSCSSDCQWLPVCSNQVLTNGGFNIPVVEGSSWNIFESSLVPGWTAEWYGDIDQYNGQVRPEEAQIEILAGVNGWGSSDNQLIELDTDWGGPSDPRSGEPASISLYQDVPTFPGYQYTLVFTYSPRPNHSDNRLGVLINGSQVFDTGILEGESDLSWATESYTFIADSSITEIRFVELGEGDSLGMMLEQVELLCQGLADLTVCKENSLAEPVEGWTVVLRGSNPVETVIVEPDGLSYSSDILEYGDYVLISHGTYEYRGRSGLLTDPGYSQRLESDGYSGPYFPWINIMDLRSPGALGIMVNGQPTDWGIFNDSHRYALGLEDYSGEISFSIWDDNYSDNVGSLSVDIYSGRLGVTRSDGCYTFEGIGFGNYEVEEIGQHNWESLGETIVSVEVGESNEDVVFINMSQGSISGYKYHDFNTNGIWDHEDSREAGLSDWIIELYNARSRSSEPVSIQLTDEAGYYHFLDVDEGDYLVCERMQEGWYSVQPGGGEVCYNISLRHTNNTHQLNFGNKQIPIYEGEFSCPEGTEETILDTLNLDSRSSVPVTYEFTNNSSYLLRASGVYQYSANSNHLADAAYGSSDGFISTRSDIGIWGTNKGVTSIIGDLGEGYGIILWDNDQMVNEDNTYSFLFETESDLSAEFVISDWFDYWYSNANFGCSNQGCMHDNNGSLKLDIIECAHISEPTTTPSPSPTIFPTPSPASDFEPSGAVEGASATSGTSSSGGGTTNSTECTDSKPSMVTNLAVFAVGINTIALSWNAVPDADDYGLLFTNLDSGVVYGASSIGNTTSYTINGITAGNYLFEIFAINGCMPGDRATISQFIVGAILTTPPIGPAGEVLGEETSEQRELLSREISQDEERLGQVAGAKISCVSSKLYLPWIILLIQLAFLLLVEYLKRRGKSSLKWILPVMITGLSILAFYLLRECQCYESRSLLAWLCVWFWIASVLETLIVRAIGYGFIEVVDE